MRREYDWDESNLAHIARHNVTPEEFEEVLANGPVYLETRIRNGENRDLELGETDAGRILFIAWTLRDGLIRPVTAWDAYRKARSKYKERSEGI